MRFCVCCNIYLHLCHGVNGVENIEAGLFFYSQVSNKPSVKSKAGDSVNPDLVSCDSDTNIKKRGYECEFISSKTIFDTELLEIRNY